jgi:TPP-dependent pyruvate/acetoin dehydrogenase alpha subunit
MDLTADAAIGLYRQMLTIRKFEERVAGCFAGGEIPGFIHLCSGQEASAVGICAALRADDLMASNHRGHGHCLAKGAEPRKMMAELFGRSTGYCRGKGGSMHLCGPALGILGTNGVVGAGIPIAVGTAVASLVRRTGQVTVAFFGDGAVNTGAAHEGFNLASVWRLPVVFVCENNGYAEFTPQATHSRVPSVAARAGGYGMPGIVVDGNDVLAVLQAGRDAVDRARRGEGPTLIEALTYRFRGHHEGDAMAYRPKGEAEEWRARDPLVRFRAWLLERGHLDEAGDRAVVTEVDATIEDALEFARQSPWPAPEQALDDVYA